MKYVSPEYQQQLENLASLLCNNTNNLRYKPFQYDVEDTRIGYDLDGNYHHPRTDVGYTDMGEYHDPALRIEHVKEHLVDVAGLDDSPYQKSLKRQAQINTLANHLMQQIVGENPYKPDMEWQLWHRVRALDQDEKGSQLPQGVTPDDVMQHYYRQFEGE